jgi:hypothetical protein
MVTVGNGLRGERLTEITITILYRTASWAAVGWARQARPCGHVGNLQGLYLMNKIMRILATTTATAALGLGASALPASAAAPTSGSWDNSSSHNTQHEQHDNNRHDAQHGWWDGESRWHDWNDGSGWRDDDGNWRSDNDHNGSWKGRDGFRHDKDGWSDHQGRRHHNDNNKHGRTW